MKYAQIPVDTIDFNDDRFRISYMTDERELIGSIRRVGLLHPVILRSEPSSGRHQVVSGFRRIASCLHLHINQIPGIVYEPGELSDARAMELTIHQTATSRSLNLIERSLALGKLKSVGHLPEQEIISDYLPLLGLEPSEKVFRSVGNLLDLTDSLKAYIVRNSVPLINASIFLTFEEEDQAELVRILSPLKPGTNRLKEILVMIDEICHRDEIGVRDIIEGEIEAVLKAQDMPTPQKTETIRSILKGYRSPRIVSLERDVQEKLKALKIPPGMSLSPPPFLEGDRLSVRFDFRDREELNRIIGKLSEISDKEALSALLDML